MSLVSAAVHLRSAETLSRIQYAVAQKILNTTQQQGEAVVELVEAAAETTDAAAEDLIGAIDLLA